MVQVCSLAASDVQSNEGTCPCCKSRGQFVGDYEYQMNLRLPAEIMHIHVGINIYQDMQSDTRILQEAHSRFGSSPVD